MARTQQPRNRSARRPKPPVRPIDTTDVVLTPGGMRPRDLVHILEPGQHVSVKGGRIRIIDTATGRVVRDLGESGSSTGETVAAPERLARPPTPALPDIGWIENAQWRVGGTDPIIYFSTTWIVPPAPASSDSQVVFLFNGMQPDSAAHILQPVLQWGSSGAGGGNYWSITNWYADGQGGAAVTHPPIQVNPGDVLQGIMTCTGQNGTEFNYTSSFVGFSSVDVTVTDVDELTWAYETLECYGSDSSTPLTQCSDYPDTPLTAMYGIEIKTGTPGTSGTDVAPDWVPVTNFTDCGQQCLVISNDSPNGAVYLYYRQPATNFYFVIDKGTFGVDEVKDVIATSGGVFSGAFFLALEGFTVQQLTVDVPSLVLPTVAGPFTILSGVTVRPSTTYAPVYDSTNLYSPQRILFPFDVVFTTNAVNNDFPASGETAVAMSAEIKFGSAALGTAQDLTANTEMFLAAGAAPYFTNVDPQQGNAFYLSQDLRVFTITPTANNQTPIDNVLFTFAGGSPTTLDTAAAYSYIRALIGHFNSAYGDPGGTDPFDLNHPVLPGQGNALTGDSTVTPATPNPSDTQHPFINYNFALARVRLQGSSGPPGEAANVRVFFRMFTTQTFDTDYINTAGAVSSNDPNITYPSLPTGSPNAPTSPLPGTNAGGQINGSSLPFFAAADQSDLAPGGVNLQTIEIPSGEDKVWAYFGCFLNVYDTTLDIGGHDPQFWLPASHHCCLVAQIAYSETPIENANGLIENPANSSLLAQRNLQVTPSGNPGFPATHLIPQTFDARPSPQPFGSGLSAYPDELMIDWGNTPPGSTAEIYWPQVKSADVLALAASLYPAVPLTAVDSYTIGCTVGPAYTFVPIPRGGNQSFAGLITLQLPNRVRAGQSFDIVVRRLTSRRYQPVVIQVQRAGAAPPATDVNWRYVAGAFQMRVPVQRDETILPGEENLLAILKWRLQWLPATDRWYPVVQRWLNVVTGRVRGLGGDPGQIQPSPLGTANQPIGLPVEPPEAELGETGKIVALRYDRFGDFVGFDLVTLDGRERHFRAREPDVEALVRRAWVERILLTVLRSHHDPTWPREIIFRGPPRHER
jgi:hypothetical protein